MTPTDLMSNKLGQTQRVNAPGVLLHEVQEQAKPICGEISQSGHLSLGGMVLTGRGLRKPPRGLKYSVLDLGGSDMGIHTCTSSPSDTLQICQFEA